MECFKKHGRISTSRGIGALIILVSGCMCFGSDTEKLPTKKTVCFKVAAPKRYSSANTRAVKDPCYAIVRTPSGSTASVSSHVPCTGTSSVVLIGRVVPLDVSGDAHSIFPDISKVSVGWCNLSGRQGEGRISKLGTPEFDNHSNIQPLRSF